MTSIFVEDSIGQSIWSNLQVLFPSAQKPWSCPPAPPLTPPHTLVRRLACLWSKMPMFQRAGMREGGEPLALAFQYLIIMIWKYCDLNLVVISSVASKCQDFKVGMPVFQPFMKWNWRPLSLKCCHFEASEDVMTNFKSQGLHIIIIKYWNAGGRN